MNCFCCGKPLKTENDNGWHKACIKRFFGTAHIPEIEIDEKTLDKTTSFEYKFDYVTDSDMIEPNETMFSIQEE